MPLSNDFGVNVFQNPARTNYVMDMTQPINVSGTPVKSATVNPAPRTAQVTPNVAVSNANSNLTAGVQAPTPVKSLTEIALEANTAAATKTAGAIEESTNMARNMQLGVAGAKFLIDIANAQNAYVATKGQAQLNIIQARNQAADAIYRGHQAGLERQLEGYNAGQQSLLSAAAQGQNVHGAGAEKVQSSYEAMGLFNGMKEEINSVREALGYQLEEVGYDYQIENAGVARENAFIGAGLELGATAAGALI